MMRALRLKWHPADGLSILAHADLITAGYRPNRFTLPDCRMLADVDSFNVVAMEYNWPRQRPTAWRDEVHRALVDIDILHISGDLMQKIDLSLMMMQLLDNDTSIEECLERLHLAERRS